MRIQNSNISALKSISFVIITFFIVTACGENQSCDCLSDEIEYIKDLRHNGQVILGPNLETENCDGIRRLVSENPVIRWKKFCNQVEDCNLFEEYMLITQDGLDRLNRNSESIKTW